MLLLVTLALTVSCTAAETENRTILDKLENALYKGFNEVWPFLERFRTQSELRVSKIDLFKGIANKGPWTNYCLTKIVKKILRQETVRVLIIGESISAGANLGCRNNKRTFHYGLASWWLKTITAATGSRLIRHQIAVGGVATNYFDRCWKEYLYDDEKFDLVLWEFAFNDADAVQQCKSIERFTRSIGKIESNPGLIFISFFRKTFFDQFLSRTAKNPCEDVKEKWEKRHEHHEENIDKIATYYGVTSLDLESTVCSALQSNSSLLTMKDMFNTDHPSFLAHAQMTFILIHHLRASFATIVKTLKALSPSYNQNTQNAKISHVKRIQESATTKKILPSPIFLEINEDNILENPICWTAVLPNTKIKPRHYLFDLKIKMSNGFVKMNKIDWRDVDERRFDSTGGFQTTKSNETIRFDFTIPAVEDSESRKISVAIRNKFFGGKVNVKVRGYRSEHDTKRRELVDLAEDVLDSSINVHTGLNVYDISKPIAPGKISLILNTLTGGVMICSIIIS